MGLIVSAISCLRFLDVANSITMLNVLISAMSLHFALNHEIYQASVSICMTAIIDFLDGYIARTWLSHKTENRIFGKQLDSLADLLNFSVVPAVIVMILLPGAASYFTGMLLIVSACLRLSVFCVISGGEPGYYRGLPTTYAGLIYSLFLLFISSGKMQPNSLLWLTAIIALLQIMNFKMRKYQALPTVAVFIALFTTSYYFAG